MDFIVSQDANIIPVEVKSESNDKSKSLAEYRKKYNPEISVKATMNNLNIGEVRHIPLYLLWQMEKYIVALKSSWLLPLFFAKNTSFLPWYFTENAILLPL